MGATRKESLRALQELIGMDFHCLDKSAPKRALSRFELEWDAPVVGMLSEELLCPGVECAATLVSRGHASGGTLHSDELAAWVAAFLQPVGVDQPQGIIVRVSRMAWSKPSSGFMPWLPCRWFRGMKAPPFGPTINE